jgi:hypothetical protein
MILSPLLQRADCQGHELPWQAKACRGWRGPSAANSLASFLQAAKQAAGQFQFL